MATTRPKVVIPFIDTCCNLLDDMFLGVYRDSAKHGADLAHVIERARTAGCTQIVCCAGSVEDSAKAIELAQMYGLRATVGVHPTQSASVDADFPAKLLELALEGKKKRVCVAIGECGLDMDRTHFSPFEQQQLVWNAHFDVANRAELPMLIHSRSCGEATIATLRANPLRFGGVVHSYDGSLEHARIIVEELGLYIGINGCSLKTMENLEVVKKIPLSRILVESDAPYCGITSTSAAFPLLSGFPSFPEEVCKTPEKLQGREGKCTVKSRNEPRNVLHVLHVLSRLHDCSLEECARITHANACALYTNM